MDKREKRLQQKHQSDVVVKAFLRKHTSVENPPKSKMPNAVRDRVASDFGEGSFSFPRLDAYRYATMNRALRSNGCQLSSLL